MKQFWQTAWAILRKDLRAEFRSRELLSLMGLFALLSILIFSFALELDRIAREEAISGVLWVTVVFSSILGLNRSLTMERESGGFDAVLMSPTGRGAIFIGKALSNWLVTLLISAFLLPLMSILYNRSLLDAWVALILLLGSAGFCIVGTLLAAMTAQTRAREALLPILLLPMALPILIGAVRATTAILNGAPFADWSSWPTILLVVDMIYAILCFLLFAYVVED